MRRRRSRNLDDAAISEIVGIVDGCAGPLSWNSLIEAIDERTRVRYTRQALNNHERIRLAFSVRRESLKATGVPMGGNTAEQRWQRCSRSMPDGTLRSSDSKPRTRGS